MAMRKPTVVDGVVTNGAFSFSGAWFPDNPEKGKKIEDLKKAAQVTTVKKEEPKEEKYENPVEKQHNYLNGINPDKAISDEDIKRQIKLYRTEKLDPKWTEGFTLEYTHGYNLIFYDYEVFSRDWCVTLYEPLKGVRTIIVNSREKMQQFWRDHHKDIWCGYNSKNYDTWILRAICLGKNPAEVSNYIIAGGKPYQLNLGWEYGVLNYEVSEGVGGYTSLKQCEAYMGEDIEETEVDFNLDRVLTQEEMNLTLKYNIHDVEQTIQVFRNTYSEYAAQISVIKTFGLDIKNIKCTKAQLTAQVIECERPEHHIPDEDKFEIVKTVKIIDKYKHIYDYFNTTARQLIREGRQKEIKYTANVGGIPHTFGLGGVHAAMEETVYIDGGRIFHADVASLYPNIMIVYDKLTRNSKDKNKYKQVLETRLALKHAGKKKEQAPYKIILNSTYGITNDQNSDAYDPRRAREITINGQMLNLTLCCMLDPLFESGKAKFIQNNTDGIIFQCMDQESEDFARAKIAEWEKLTGLGMEIDEISFIVQKDVNNYLFQFTNGKIEVKGAMMKESNDLDYNMPIVNEALREYFKSGKTKTPEQTINECDDLRKFQIVFRMMSQYKELRHMHKALNGRTARVFASKDMAQDGLYKVKAGSNTEEKVGNTPEHCFVENGYIRGKSCSEYPELDKNWYVELANERLKMFGVDLTPNIFDFF